MGGRFFARKYMYEKCTKCPNIYDICLKKNKQSSRILHEICPKNARILHNNSNYAGTCSSAPTLPSPTPIHGPPCTCLHVDKLSMVLNSFTVTFSRKFAIKWLLNIPPHLKRFENRPVFDEVMCRQRRLTFFDPPCIPSHCETGLRQ